MQLDTFSYSESALVALYRQQATFGVFSTLPEFLMGLKNKAIYNFTNTLITIFFTLDPLLILFIVLTLNTGRVHPDVAPGIGNECASCQKIVLAI